MRQIVKMELQVKSDLESAAQMLDYAERKETEDDRKELIRICLHLTKLIILDIERRELMDFDKKVII